MGVLRLTSTRSCSLTISIREIHTRLGKVRRDANACRLEYIYHSYIPRRVGQTRGYPLAAPVLWDMNMLDKYFDAELTAARAGAQMFGTVERG